MGPRDTLTARPRDAASCRGASNDAGVVEPEGGLDDVRRPVLHLLVDPADVLAHDAEAEKLDPAEERDEDHDGRIAGRERESRPA